MSDLGRSILITGGTSGLGYQCALELARQCPEARILIASRSDTNSAAASINKALGQTNVQYLPLDLSNLDNVRAFAAEYAEGKYPKIQALVLNAGLQFPNGVTYTKDGVESTFAINHVGHALLFHLLRPHLAEKARIVITASGTHDPAQKSGLPDAEYTTAEELAHPSPQSAKNSGRQRYATSKLCNVMWTYALDKRLIAAAARGEERYTVNAFDPGLMPGTDLVREASAVLRWIWNNVMPRMIPLLRRFVHPNIHSPEESGIALARLAVGEDVAGVSGAYFEGTKKINSSVESHVVEKQEDLWHWTVKHVARDEEELRTFDSL
ncbi:hypothetical protein EPUS_08053 [Endocarpon pusillum Z07020]|uniref:NAD(P)-binding protein n=1 Tax=Endocarpon pusillum (strain Z07020 / HMAS-L-300199) TaxID=1263415 RepID=U1GRK2_ENDPU|nr:uncharacterized protein EPUS_08053 [Endocarpon pusillum Z07020]ERF75008.1 hypothetical protein EPUS_08053 [Endocarpon pusillum Z07020]